MKKYSQISDGGSEGQDDAENHVCVDMLKMDEKYDTNSKHWSECLQKEERPRQPIRVFGLDFQIQNANRWNTKQNTKKLKGFHDFYFAQIMMIDKCGYDLESSSLGFLLS